MRSAAVIKLLIVLLTAGLCAWAVSILRPAPGPVVRDFVDPATIPGTAIDEDVAKLLFGCLVRSSEQPRHRFDPVSGVALLPDLDIEHHWPEHPWRKLRLRTNAQGFREDQDTAIETSAYRILVTGDSHTEGFVWNHESVANVLEARLRQRGSGEYDVVNAGIGATGPYNHLGVLRNQLKLHPDVFVCILFTGNDLANALDMNDFFTKRRRGPYPEGYRERLIGTIEDASAAEKRWGRAIVGNGFQQAYRFMHFPEEGDIALQAAIGWYTEMADLCADRGIEFLVVVLPAKPEVDHDDDEYVDQILTALDMSRGDYALNRRLALRFVEALRARGVAVVDTALGLARAPGPSFWSRDHHLSVAGCQRVAEEVLQALEPRLP